MSSAGSAFPSQQIELQIQAARIGSKDALGRLLQRFRQYLLLIAHAELPDDVRPHAGPSDVVQETFLEAHRDFADFQGRSEAEFVAWLQRILRHNVLDVIRRSRCGPVRAVFSDDSINLRCSSSKQESGTERSAGLDRAEEVEFLLRRLPDHYRQVVEMRNLELRSFVEIARLTGRSPDAVRKLWARAIELLEELRDSDDLR